MYRPVGLGLAGVACLATALAGAELRPAGVLGNSGYAGATLLRERPEGFPGGVAFDEDRTLWRVASAERLERLSLDGRLLRAWRIEGARMVDPGHNVRLALVGGYVVAMSVDSGQLVAIRRDAPPTETMKPLKLDPPIPMWYATGFAGRGLDGLAVLDGGNVVWAVDPATGKATKLFDSPLQRFSEHGLEVAPDGTIYLTGWTAEGQRTFACDKTSRRLRRGGATWGRINAVPGGLLSITFNAAQLMPEALGEAEPLIWHSTIELNRAGQALPLGADVYAVAAMMGPIYLMRRTGSEVTPFRRLGGIVPRALGITSDNKVIAAIDGGWIAWGWDDPSDAPPVENQLYADILRVQQTANLGALTWGIKQGYRATEPIQAWAWPPARYGIQWSDLKEGRPERPLGFGITQDGRVLLSAEKDTNLYTTTVNGGLVAGTLKKVTWTDGTTLRSPGDIGGWSKGRAVVADGNELVLIEPDGAGYKQVWRLGSWSGKAEEKFGDELHLAIAADILVVSDTKRHRVLMFSLPERKLIGQLGTTGVPGTGIDQLDSPAAIATNGLRVAIADRGNCRIVKYELKP